MNCYVYVYIVCRYLNFLCVVNISFGASCSHHYVEIHFVMRIIYTRNVLCVCCGLYVVCVSWIVGVVCMLCFKCLVYVSWFVCDICCGLCVVCVTICMCGVCYDLCVLCVL